MINKVKELMVSETKLPDIYKELRKDLTVKEAKELIADNKYLRVAFNGLKKKRTKRQEQVIIESEDLLSAGLKTAAFERSPYIKEGIDTRQFILPLITLAYHEHEYFTSADITTYKVLTKEEEEVLTIFLRLNYKSAFDEMLKWEYSEEYQATTFSYKTIVNSIDIFTSQSDSMSNSNYLYIDDEVYVDTEAEPYKSRMDKYIEAQVEKEIEESIKGEYKAKPKPGDYKTGEDYMANGFGFMFTKMEQDKKYKRLLDKYPTLFGITDLTKFNRIRKKILKQVHPDITKSNDTQEFLITQGDMKFIKGYISDEDNIDKVIVKSLK